MEDWGVVVREDECCARVSGGVIWMCGVDRECERRCGKFRAVAEVGEEERCRESGACT